MCSFFDEEVGCLLTMEWFGRSVQDKTAGVGFYGRFFTFDKTELFLNLMLCY